MENLKPNKKRAKNAITLIWFVLGLEIVSLISGYYQYDLLQTVAEGGEISIGTALANDTREQMIGIIYLIVFVISGVTFIQWFRRAYFNLHLVTRSLTHSEGWASGSWFVPILNLFRPFQIMKEIYEETEIVLSKRNFNPQILLPVKFVSIWWILWTINNIIGQFVFRYSMKAESIDELTRSAIASLCGNIVAIPLALITIKIIKDYSNIEPMLYEINNFEETIIK